MEEVWPWTQGDMEKAMGEDQPNLCAGSQLGKVHTIQLAHKTCTLAFTRIQQQAFVLVARTDCIAYTKLLCAVSGTRRRRVFRPCAQQSHPCCNVLGSYHPLAGVPV
jgi:hypothetical protein